MPPTEVESTLSIEPGALTLIAQAVELMGKNLSHADEWRRSGWVQVILLVIFFISVVRMFMHLYKKIANLTRIASLGKCEHCASFDVNQ